MTDPTRGLVDEWNDGYMADLAVSEDVAESKDRSTVSGPEEMLERLETFVDIGFTANAKHVAKEFQEAYDIDLEELIQGTKYERSCLADL